MAKPPLCEGLPDEGRLGAPAGTHQANPLQRGPEAHYIQKCADLVPVGHEEQTQANYFVESIRPRYTCAVLGTGLGSTGARLTLKTLLNIL